MGVSVKKPEVDNYGTSSLQKYKLLWGCFNLTLLWNASKTISQALLCSSFIGMVRVQYNIWAIKKRIKTKKGSSSRKVVS